MDGRDKPVIICIILARISRHVRDSFQALAFALLPFIRDYCSFNLTSSPITPHHAAAQALQLFLLLLVDGCHHVQAALGENRLGFVCAIICPRGFTAPLVAFEPSSRDYLGSRAEFSQRQPFVLLKGLFPPHVSKRLCESSYNLCIIYE